MDVAHFEVSWIMDGIRFATCISNLWRWDQYSNVDKDDSDMVANLGVRLYRGWEVTKKV